MATAEQGLTTGFMTTYRDFLLQGFAREVEITKKAFSVIPDDKSGYRPDPHARSAWELAWHLANTDVQFLDGIADGEFKMETPTEENKPKSAAELVKWYDQNIARATARVRALTPERLMRPIEFFGVFNYPAAMYLAFLNNHSIHHRGELATYLRPMGSKCPSIYGGSYDEPFQPAASQAA